MSRDNLRERWEEYYSTAIVKGLKAALSEESIESSVDEFDDAHIKLNKLMYVAMAERGLHNQMQHSWHRYGADLGSLVPSTFSVGPTPLDDLPETQEPSLPTTGEVEIDVWDETDYCVFFKSVSIGSLESLEQILNAERTLLLREFYTEYSGNIEEWLDLYLINVRIQEYLRLHQTDQLEDFGEQEYTKLVDTISEFRRELYSHEELSPHVIDQYSVNVADGENPADLLSEFLELVDDVFYSLSKRQVEEFNSLSYPLEKVEEFYHNRAWKLVTEFISLNTTHGPNQESLKYGAKSDIEQIVSRYSIKMDRVESECRVADLLPEDPEEPTNTPAEEDPADQLPTQEEFRQALEGEEA